MPLDLRSPVKKWVQRKLDLEPVLEHTAMVLRKTRARSGPKSTNDTANDLCLSIPNDRSDMNHYAVRREYRYPRTETQRGSTHNDHQRRKSEQTIYEEDRAAREEAIARQARAIVRQEKLRRDQENLLAEQLEAKARQREAEDRIHQIDLDRTRRIRGQSQRFWADEQQLRPRESDISIGNRSLSMPQFMRARESCISQSSDSDNEADRILSRGPEFDYSQTDKAGLRLPDSKEYGITEVRGTISPGQKPRSFPVLRDNVGREAPQYRQRIYDNQLPRKKDGRDDLVVSDTGGSRSAEALAAQIKGRAEPLSTKNQVVPQLNLKTKPRGRDHAGVTVEQSLRPDQRRIQVKDTYHRSGSGDLDDSKSKESIGSQQNRYKRDEHRRSDREKIAGVAESMPRDITTSMSRNEGSFNKPENSNRMHQDREHSQQENSITTNHLPPCNVTPNATASRSTAPRQDGNAILSIPPKTSNVKPPAFPVFPASESTDHWHPSQKPPVSKNRSGWLSDSKTPRKVQFADAAGSKQREDTTNFLQTQTQDLNQPINPQSGDLETLDIPPRISPRPAAILKPASQRKALKYDPVRDSASTWSPPVIDRSSKTTDTPNDWSVSQHPTSTRTAENRQGLANTRLPPPPNNMTKPRIPHSASGVKTPGRSQSTRITNRWQNTAVPSLEHYAEQKIWREV